MSALLARGADDLHILSANDLIHIGRFADTSGLDHVFDLVIELALSRGDRPNVGTGTPDAVRDPDGTSSDIPLVRDLLLLCSRSPVLRQHRVLPLFERLQSLESVKAAVPQDPSIILQSLPPKVLSLIVKTISSQSNLETHLPLIAAIFPPMLRNASQQFSPSSPHGSSPMMTQFKPTLSSTPRHAVGIWSLYNLVLCLVHSKYDVLALDLFSQLSRSGHIPPPAIVIAERLGRSLPLEDQANVNLIILSTLAKATQTLGWRDRTVRIAKDLIAMCTKASAPSASLPVLSVIEDLVESLMQSTNTLPASLQAALHIIVASIENPHLERISPRIIQDCYSLLHDEKLHLEMSALYLRLRDVTHTSVAYLPPSQRALIGLMGYYVSRDDYRSARILTEDIVARPMGEEEPQYCSSIISAYVALLARIGQHVQAREMWEAAGEMRGAELVLGNASVVMKMVNMFASLSEAKRSQAPMTGTAFQRQTSILEPSHRVPPPNDDQTYVPRTQNHLEIHEYRTFARSIVATFTQLKSPLSTASHEDLTTLARANFRLDALEPAFEAMSHILSRREIPDGHDVNIILAGIARYDPMRAFQMAEKALGKGVEIDRVAWNTLLHEAFRHDDPSLAGLVMQRSKAEGTGLDTYSLDTLVRHGMKLIRNGEPSRAIIDSIFQRSAVLVEHAIKEGHSLRPSLGVVCVQTALRNHRPVFAFQFWRHLLKGKAKGRSLADTRDRDTASADEKGLEVAIAKALKREWEGGNSKVTWEGGWSMCQEMQVPDKWTVALDDMK